MASHLDKIVIEGNKKFASTHTGQGLDMHPSRKVAIITCMDCRVDPIALCGFKTSEATIIRNAGAYPEEAARSALLTTHVLGVEDIYIIKHTKCGMLGVSTEFAHDVIKKNLGLASSKDVDDFAIHGIDDIESSAREAVEYFRKHPLRKPGTGVKGWIYDTDSGLLNLVATA